MQPTNQGSQNPLQGLISSDAYETLAEHNLLNEKGVRDYNIRKVYTRLRKQNKSSFEAIETLREEHPYLQFDTIRKIVYRMGAPA